MVLTQTLFLLLCLASLGLAAVAPARWFLSLWLLVVLLPGSIELGTLLVDATDAVLFGLLLALVLRYRVGPLREIPYLRTWLVLGLLLSVAYLTAPINQPYLTSPERVAYQLYRYAWKGILLYPLGVLALAGRREVQHLLVFVVISADVAALWATIEGYAGQVPIGPFDTRNTLAGAIVIPTLISGVGLLYARGAPSRLFWGGSLLLLGRAVVFSASRGGFAALLAGMLFGAVCLIMSRRQWSRLTQAVALACAALLLILVIKPDLMERPNVQRLYSLRDGVQDSNFQWRIQERWPHFFEMVVERPWLGWGTAVDPELSRSANTPHNGFLALAVKHGIPVMLLYVLFAALLLRNGLRLFFRSTDRFQQCTGLALAAGVAGMLTHNIVDSMLMVPYVESLFWLACAVLAVQVRNEERAASTESQHEQPARAASPAAASAA